VTLDLDFLAQIRTAELQQVVSRVQASDRLLEIGAGAGLQARVLRDRGLRIVAVDVRGSMYEAARVFPVILYDGVHLPFRNDCFDVVFSSSVLEHVERRTELHGEIRRVLTPSGRCIHILPTAAWRLWTSVAHYVELARASFRLWFGRGAAGAKPGWAVPRRLAQTLELCRARGFPVRHGEHGTALAEMWLFRAKRWNREFRRAGFEIVESRRMGLFYTGHMVLGGRLSIPGRRWLAAVLGSACRLYNLKAVEGRADPSTGSGDCDRADSSA
jgi:SAM-dependent methyltransferase